ncbi:MAG: chemotaxis protein CheC [Lachnospiraceae bacterium]|jgi:chemotaxis protein CheC|nr:chemotaxis protein CheC [Lachnospiraceae bacterium]
MKDISMEELSGQYYDVLKELGNIGAGNATTALAQMLGSKVDMSVPQVQLLDFNVLGDTVGGEDEIMAGIYLQVEGDIQGNMMFIQKKVSAAHLINKMMAGMIEIKDEEVADYEFGEMECSAIKEVGNIITGAYLNALSSLTNLKIYPSVPQLAIDMAGALLSVPAVEFGLFADKILLVQTKFSDDVELDGFFILIPDMESYEKILTVLGVI